MGQELTPAQLERLKQQKALRFQAMGLPAAAGQIVDIPVENMPTQRVYKAPVQVVEESYEPQNEAPQKPTNVEIPNESNVAQQIQIQLAEERAMRQNALYTAPRDKFNALDAIRKGAKKQEFKTFIKAESHGSNGNQIPVPKVGRKPVRPGQPQERSKTAVPVQQYNAPKNPEADALESMFTDRAPGISMRSSGNGVPQGDLIQTDENYSNIGPTFDPVAHLKAKAAEKGVNLELPQRQQTPQVFQTDNSGQMQQMMLMMETMMKNQQKPSGYDLSTLKPTIEAIAKRIAEDTIRKVLKEYVESQKKKKVFEVVSAKQNVVKIDNEFFQLKKVNIKTNTSHQS